jgi:hypothetical protein
MRLGMDSQLTTTEITMIFGAMIFGFVMICERVYRLLTNWEAKTDQDPAQHRVCGCSQVLLT